MYPCKQAATANRYKLFSPRIASHNVTRVVLELSLSSKVHTCLYCLTSSHPSIQLHLSVFIFSSTMEITRVEQLFGELLQATRIDPLKEMTEQEVTGDIEQWLYDDEPDSIRDVPDNLSGEEKRGSV